MTLAKPMAMLLALALLAGCSADAGMGGDPTPDAVLAPNTADTTMMNEDTTGSVIPSN